MLAGEAACLLELLGGICMLPVIRIIVPALIPLCGIYVYLHLSFPFFQIREWPLQHVTIRHCKHLCP